MTMMDATVVWLMLWAIVIGAWVSPGLVRRREREQLYPCTKNRWWIRFVMQAKSDLARSRHGR